MKKAKKITRSSDNPGKDLIKLGKRIRELRIKKGYKSYEIFAYENDFSRAQMGRYENGENLRYESLLKVIRALGVTPKEFFNEGID
jgi:transcriptional regulator with XRE-family HTH domain